MGEIGQGALVGFVAFAPAFAEKDSGWGVPVGDDGDIHVDNKSYTNSVVKRNINAYMRTNEDSRHQPSLWSSRV
jgi:hypothetical protein